MTKEKGGSLDIANGEGDFSVLQLNGEQDIELEQLARKLSGLGQDGNKKEVQAIVGLVEVLLRRNQYLTKKILYLEKRIEIPEVFKVIQRIIQNIEEKIERNLSKAKKTRTRTKTAEYSNSIS